AEFPGYFKDISDEIIMNGKASKSYHELRAAIVASAKARAAESELEKRAGDRLKRDEDWKVDYANEVRELHRLQNEKNKIREAGRLTYAREIEMNTRITKQQEYLKQLEKERFDNKINDHNQDKAYLDAI